MGQSHHYKRLVNFDRDRYVMLTLAHQFHRGIINRKEAINMFRTYLIERGLLWD